MFLTLKHETKEQHMADVIVYGIGFQAVAEVAKATNNAFSKSVIVIVQYKISKLCGIATVGEQNYWDMHVWTNIRWNCSQLYC